jgi:hypothetical protein
MSGPTLTLSRLAIFGFLLLVPGLYYGIRFTSGFVRVLSRKFRRGVPYLRGSAIGYSLFALGSLGVACVGAGLTASAVLQSGFQSHGKLREVGMVEARELPGGRLRVAFRIEPGHPGPAEGEADLPAVRWALEGAFLDWRFGPRWLGFSSGHRIEAILGTRTDTGDPAREADTRSIVAGTYAPWHLAHRHPAWIPHAATSRHRTPWMPAGSARYRVFAGAAGYVLVEDRGEAEGSPVKGG